MCDFVFRSMVIQVTCRVSPETNLLLSATASLSKASGNAFFAFPLLHFFIGLQIYVDIGEVKSVLVGCIIFWNYATLVNLRNLYLFLVWKSWFYALRGFRHQENWRLVKNLCHHLCHLQLYWVLEKKKKSRRLSQSVRKCRLYSRPSSRCVRFPHQLLAFLVLVCFWAQSCVLVSES